MHIRVLTTQTQDAQPRQGPAASLTCSTPSRTLYACTWMLPSAFPNPPSVPFTLACYRRARQRFPLPASTIQQARDKALSIYRSVQARRRKKHKTSQPRLRRLLPLRLAVENLRIFADQGVIRVTTPEGFLWLPVLVPEVWQHLIKLPHGVSEIVKRGQDWYLMLAVKTEEVPGHDGPHFGLDLGLANLAVLSGPGIVRFFDGKALRCARGRYFRYRQALQRKRKTGMVKRSKGRESRWVRCENHRVSRQIVDTVAAHGGVLHVEKLLGIRDRTKKTRKVNRMLHAWPFAQLLGFICYKAALARYTGCRRGPPAHQPAVQPLSAYGTRQPPPAGSLPMQGMWLRGARGPECGPQSRCWRDMFLRRARRDTGLKQGKGGSSGLPW